MVFPVPTDKGFPHCSTKAHMAPRAQPLGLDDPADSHVIPLPTPYMQAITFPLRDRDLGSGCNCQVSCREGPATARWRWEAPRLHPARSAASGPTRNPLTHSLQLPGVRCQLLALWVFIQLRAISFPLRLKVRGNPDGMRSLSSRGMYHLWRAGELGRTLWV